MLLSYLLALYGMTAGLQGRHGRCCGDGNMLSQRESAGSLEMSRPPLVLCQTRVYLVL